MRASDVLNIARAEVGVTEQPSGSNKVKYNNWFYGREVSGSAYPWCMAFVQWVFNQAGHIPGIVTASCNAYINAFKTGAAKDGQLVYGDYQPGDIIFFNFDSSPDADHVGIVESNNGKLITIEGNTSKTSQDNGGAVMRRDDHGRYAICAVRPIYDAEEAPQKEDTMSFAEQYQDYRKDLQDNDASAWSAEAREWAISTGLIQGGGQLPDGQPNYMWQDVLTREQLVTILHRFAKMMGRA